MGVSRRRSSPTFSRKFASASQPIQLEDGQEFSTQKLSGQRDDDNGDDFLGSISTRSVFQFFFQYFPENFTVFSYRKKPIKYRNFGKIPKKPEKTALAEVDPHKYTKTKIKMGLFLVDNSNGATRTPHPATHPWTDCCGYGNKHASFCIPTGSWKGKSTYERKLETNIKNNETDKNEEHEIDCLNQSPTPLAITPYKS